MELKAARCCALVEVEREQVLGVRRQWTWSDPVAKSPAAGSERSDGGLTLFGEWVDHPVDDVGRALGLLERWPRATVRLGGR